MDEYNSPAHFKKSVSDFVRGLIPEGQDKNQADNSLGVIGCISFFKDRAEKAEAAAAEFKERAEHAEGTIEFVQKLLDMVNKAPRKEFP